MKSYLPDSARNFDDLPDSACIDIGSVIAITGRSRATIYRWIKAGRFPAPIKVAGSNSQNLWFAGVIRRAMSGN